MPKIVLSLDDNQIREFDLEKEETMIGRRSSNDIQIQNLAVSGRHAKIIIALNDAFLEDLGSTNGTYVNGRLIKKQALKDGDEIIIGKYKLVFHGSEKTEQDERSGLLHKNNDELAINEQAVADIDVGGSKYNSAIIEVKN
ncbi:MAG: FHA domain-containing protein, partial [Gammaproteobacteria bacterium]|nr:FHA domain-containing protein [Gammaproteobacteria bacterium]